MARIIMATDTHLIDYGIDAAVVTITKELLATAKDAMALLPKQAPEDGGLWLHEARAWYDDVEWLYNIPEGFDKGTIDRLIMNGEETYIPLDAEDIIPKDTTVDALCCEAIFDVIGGITFEAATEAGIISLQDYLSIEDLEYILTADID